MAINDAWRRSNGSNKTIGLSDTGIYASSQQMIERVRTGQSGQRNVTYLATTRYASPFIPDGECSHGTRMAGVLTAPMDGIGPVGVAWGANFVSVRSIDDVVVYNNQYTANFEVASARDGIAIAAFRSDIIVLAWGTLSWYNSIEAEIEDWYYNRDKLFVGAAGTFVKEINWCEPGLYTFRPGVVFPAKMEEVVAVTAIHPNGYLACNVSAGPEVEFVSYVIQSTAGRNAEVLNVEGSSNAAAIVAAQAALVWSYFGGSREDVLQRLRSAASTQYIASDGFNIGYGIINAYRALGGFWRLLISGPNVVYPDFGETQATYTAEVYGGNGPFSYYWYNNGATTPSITLPVGPAQDTIFASVQVTDHSDGKVHYVTKKTVVANQNCQDCMQ
jgi:hypothetical protein